MKNDVPFRLVIEEQEEKQYAELVGKKRLLVLPFSNLGLGSIPARNWIMEHAIKEGHARHWQLDDNIRVFRRMHDGMRIPCDPGLALRVCEDMTEVYENVGISGLNYQMFVTGKTATPFFVNVHVYSCTLINNVIPHRWRGRYNEDTDICLQVLADGWCTILLNAFMADKMPSGVTAGGNQNTIYDKAVEDGRLKMARELERRWPGVVKVSRLYGRAQHQINWKAFKKVANSQLSLLEEPGPEYDPPELKRKPRELWPVRDYDLSISVVSEPQAERYRELAVQHGASLPSAASDDESGGDG